MVCVIENEALGVSVRGFCIRGESWYGGIFGKGEIQELIGGGGCVGGAKPLVAKVFGVGEEGEFLLGGEDDQPFFTLFPAVFYALVQQLAGIAVAFELAGYPQAVDVHISFSLDWSPGVLGRDVFDETFSPDIALFEYQALF